MFRTPEEEAVNAYTHLFATFLSTIAAILLVFKAPDNIARIQSLILGGCSSYAFFASFLYHGSAEEISRARNRVLDRAAIFIMISGSGLSLSLSNQDSITTSVMIVVIIALSSALTTKYCLSREENETASLISYILLAWVCLLPGTGLFGINLISSNHLEWIISSGVLYSIGVVFYVYDSKKWYHTAWHIMVMLGYGTQLCAFWLLYQ